MRACSPTIRTFLALAACALATGCGGGRDSTVEIVAIGEPGDAFTSGVRLPPAAQLVRAATFEGLVALDAQGRVIPALADRWIVTEDGQSYIFRVRDGTWRDGAPLTGRSARDALRQAICELHGTAFALDLAGIEEIREMAGRVVEIRLARPMPDLLQLLAQPELGLRHGTRGAGPMRLEREGRTAILTPLAPERLGLPAVAGWQERVRAVRLDSLDGEAAVARFNRGEADVLLNGRIETFPLASSVGLLRGTIQLDPVIGLFGLAAVNAEGFLSESSQREALAMAIDRDALINAFGVGGWTPSTRIVATGVEEDSGAVGERWSQQALDARREVAAARVAAWRQAGGGAPRVRIALPSGPGANILFSRLRQDLAAIGVAATRVREGAPADLVLVDEVARVARASWFLNRFNCGTWKGLCDKGADILAGQAARAETGAERLALLADAEAELTQANVFIPFGPPIRWSLVRGSAIGFATNRWGWHPLMPMALLPR